MLISMIDWVFFISSPIQLLLNSPSGVSQDKSQVPRHAMNAVKRIPVHRAHINDHTSVTVKINRLKERVSACVRNRLSKYARIITMWLARGIECSLCFKYRKCLVLLSVDIV